MNIITHISGQRSAIVQLAQLADDPAFLFCARQVLGDPHYVPEEDELRLAEDDRTGLGLTEAWVLPAASTPWRPT